MGGARLAAAHPGLHHRGRKSSVSRFVILTWDVLEEEKSPSNALAGHVCASDQGRTQKLISLICQQKFELGASSAALCIVLEVETAIYRTTGV